MSIVSAILKTTRPRQWPKNVFVFAALVFSHRLFEPAAILATVQAFVAFCMMSGAVYLMNDIRDREKDRLHPEKMHRPLAKGALSPSVAWIACVVLMVLAEGLALTLSRQFGLLLAGYFVLNIFYTFYLKNEVILDVLLVALCYVMRVMAGGLVIDVRISNYLLLCTILLALLLAIGKRRHELLMVEEASSHRRILQEYSPELLEQMMGVVTASIVVCYALYTQEAVGGTKNLIITVPFVIYGIFRYLYLIHKKEMGGDPAEILFHDWRMSLNVVLWVATSVAWIYLR